MRRAVQARRARASSSHPRSMTTSQELARPSRRPQACGSPPAPPGSGTARLAAGRAWSFQRSSERTKAERARTCTARASHGTSSWVRRSGAAAAAGWQPARRGPAAPVGAGSAPCPSARPGAGRGRAGRPARPPAQPLPGRPRSAGSGRGRGARRAPTRSGTHRRRRPSATAPAAAGRPGRSPPNAASTASAAASAWSTSCRRPRCQRTVCRLPPQRTTVVASGTRSLHRAGAVAWPRPSPGAGSAAARGSATTTTMVGDATAVLGGGRAPGGCRLRRAARSAGPD